MDLERLNKSQIVLLTLLISFVTSIATGIVTVSLMEQAPQAITQTVNRVVERTIEKVAPEVQVAAAAAGEPVIIRESDLISTAIETVAPSVMRLYMMGKDENGVDAKLFIGHAIVVDANGVLIADAGTPDGTIIVLRPDGVEVAATVVARPPEANMVRLQAATTVGEDNKKVVWVPAALASKNLSLGKAVVAIGGRTATKVAQGIITGTSGTGTDTGAGFVETNIPAESFAAGSPLIDSDGNIVAIATRDSRAAAPGGFLASSAVVLQNKAAEAAPSSP
ncbi:MAG: serine protease [Minisyncoccia bacterium]